MTLNGLIAPILHYFTKFDSFVGRLGYVNVVEDRPTMSAECCLHFWLKLTHPAARSLCDSWPACQTVDGMQRCRCVIKRSNSPAFCSKTVDRS